MIDFITQQIGIYAEILFSASEVFARMLCDKMKFEIFHEKRESPSPAINHSDRRIKTRKMLTSVLKRCYHELKSVINSPRISHVLKRDVIGAREECSKLFSCILAADRVMVAANMSSIVDVN